MEEQEPIQIIIADDVPRLRQYFERMLDQQPDMEVVASCSNGREAVSAALQYKPDVMMLDIQMEQDDDGILAAEEVLKVFPQMCIVMLTIHKEEDLIFKSFETGIVDYILKTEPEEVIVQSLRDAFRGKATMRHEVATKMKAEFARIRVRQKQVSFIVHMMSALTRTELDILTLYAEGNSYNEIAQKRFTERTTIRAHVSNILKKFKKNRLKDVIKQLQQYQAIDLLRDLNEQNREEHND